MIGKHRMDCLSNEIYRILYIYVIYLIRTTTIINVNY
jgi:hypothetical protein